jgi:hypothetical protein
MASMQRRRHKGVLQCDRSVYRRLKAQLIIIELAAAILTTLIGSSEAPIGNTVQHRCNPR